MAWHGVCPRNSSGISRPLIIAIFSSCCEQTSFVAEAEFRPDDSPEASMFTKRTLERTGFGAKEITFFGSVALLLNNITGARTSPPQDLR